MGDLAVTVRYHGQVVEDRVLKVRRLVRLGEAFGAAVSFPGADLTVVRGDRALLVRGRSLQEGDEMRLELGTVDVRLAHTVSERLPQDLEAHFDLRFLLCALLLAALGAWLDAAEAWTSRHLTPEGGLVAWIEDLRRDGSPPARAAGPQHPTP